MRDKINRFLETHVRIIFILVFLFVIIRALEYCYILTALNEPLTLSLFFSRSVNFDSLLIFLYSLVLIVPLFFLSLASFRLYSIIHRSLAFILVFIDLALTHYFLTSNSLLTSQLFEFSLSDIGEIISSEFTVNRLPLWIGLGCVTILSAYILFFKKFAFSKKIRLAFYIAYGLGIVISLLNVDHTFKEFKYFDSNYQYLTGNSKISYFIKSYYVSREKNTGFNFFAPKDLENSNFYHETNNGRVFTSREFPFIHNEPYHNVLGPFFKKSTIRPNIVIIISESLSAVVSGKHTLAGSITPFTDSLKKAGLSWQYFLSNAHRSFGAVPNILASTPPGTSERGFINTKVEYLNDKKYPSHLTLIDLLKQNGYVTNFYYGGWGEFDNLCYYFKEKQLDNFVSEGDFDDKKYGMRKDILTNKVWGFNDKQLFDQSLAMFKKHVNNKPFLSVYQTLSTHSPYNLSEDSYYTDEYLNNKLSAIKVSKYIYEKVEKKVMSSVFFADDALKFYFTKFKEQPEFNNTIFIITGDHSLGMGMDPNPFKNYWIPLVIYSPLLEKTGEFKGLCSHIDILPSLLALLQQNFGLNFPENKHWIGEGLDTSHVFTANRTIPLNLTAMDMPNFIIGNNVLYGNDIFRFDSTLNIFKEPDNAKAEITRKKINNFCYLNSYVCLRNKIWN